MNKAFRKAKKYHHPSCYKQLMSSLVHIREYIKNDARKIRRANKKLLEALL